MPSVCVWVVGGAAFLVATALVVSWLRFFRVGDDGLCLGEVRLLCAYYETLLRHASFSPQPSVKAVVAEMASTMAALPRGPRCALAVAYWAFERLPWLTLRGWLPFSRLSLHARQRVLRRASVSRGFVVTALFEIVHLPALVALAGCPEILDLCGVHRATNVATRRAQRAQALAGATDQP